MYNGHRHSAPKQILVFSQIKLKISNLDIS
ncbi:hypothetical protein MPLDJ20_120422 [Mesorhizobium plurifarium]|uniref:Uncharacterized protein n=1 Tax=Mesorhizobium plurifarium TaxID=69974 RepID=A0A090EKN4_MESPL|nr:hypothetical protein MPLDJ20_120422 [Mesorhizobium plurifarium]